MPSIDGNIYRVLSRLFASNKTIFTSKGKKFYFELAKDLMDEKHPGDFNQAMMELGALVCTPKQYACEKCPLEELCEARMQNKVQEYPARKRKEASKIRFLYYIVLVTDNSIFFRKRTGSDIWKNLYDFPLIESEYELTIEQVLTHPMFIALTRENEFVIDSYSEVYKHILSHQTIFARFFHVNIKSLNNSHSDFVAIDKNNIFEIAIPRLIDRYIHNQLLKEIET